MTEDQAQKLDELHDFFMKPPLAGKPSRAQQIDDVLVAVRTGKLSVRALLWSAGALAAVAAAYAQIKGLWK